MKYLIETAKDFAEAVIVPIVVILVPLILLFFVLFAATEPYRIQQAEANHQEYITLCQNTGKRLADCELRYAELTMIRDSVRSAKSNRDAEDMAATQYLFMNP